MTDINKLRHSLSHIMAQSIQREIGINVKFGIGPVINNGFYYDILFTESFPEENLKMIESSMKIIIKEKQLFKELKFDLETSYKILTFLHQDFKKQLAEELQIAGESMISFYVNLIDITDKDKLLNGLNCEYLKYLESINSFISSLSVEIDGKFITFIDMCEGPHVNSTHDIILDSFKLDRISGAYWKGDEHNQMMTRIYGIAFQNHDELVNHIGFIEEAKKRDHRILGKKLDLFCFSELVGPGLPLFTPRGTIVIDELRKCVEEICSKYGFQKVMTPHLSKINLYDISGHANKFSDELFHVTSSKNHKFVMKPVQCPHQTQIYASKPRSYKELPIRYMESEKQYRAEKSGEVGGLGRVYAITVEDGHSFCTVDQVKDEVIGMIKIIKDFYTVLGLCGNHRISLSVRDYGSPEKYIGDKSDWDKCEFMLQQISDELGLNAVKCEGEAALYGPKLDFMFKDALGKEFQIPTVQVDFATPKRFNLVYTDKDGNSKHPVMVHRAILGSYERFFMLMIEHFGGFFPVWLSPEQVRIVPVSNEFTTYCEKILDQFRTNNIRSSLDNSDLSFSKKIRNAELMKVNYIIVIGQNEVDNNIINIRDFKTKQQKTFTISEFLLLIQNQIKQKLL